MKAPKDKKYNFSNHLGLKVEKRKNRRKKKKLLKKHAGGSKKKGFQNSQQLANGKQASPSQKSKNGKAMSKSPKNKKNFGSSKSGQAVVKKGKKDMEDTGGFKLSSSDKERMARLQEFVNQESGKMNKPSKKKTGNKKQPVLEKQEANLIKNKKKLMSIRRDQEDDTKEIKRMAALLNLRTDQKKKVAPIFADDFGDILADIEEGTMKRSSAYTDEKVHKTFMNSSDSEESESDSDLELGDNDDDEENTFNKVNGKARDNVARENQNKKKKKPPKNSDVEDNTLSDQEFGSSGIEDFFEEEHDSDTGDMEDDSNEEQDSDTGFIDKEAEECSEEESDGEVPFHDETKEYELAFEGGSCLSQRGASVIDNGVMGYSSNSDDDTDLEDFVVDDDYVEFESGVESDVVDDDKALSPPKKRKRRRVINEETDEDEQVLDNDSTLPSPKKTKRNRLEDSDEEEANMEVKPSKKAKKKKCMVLVTSESEKDSATITPTQKKKKLKKQKKNMKEKGNDKSCTENEVDELLTEQPKNKKSEKKSKKKKKKSENSVSDNKDSDLSEVQDCESNGTQLQSDDITEDIYGRLRDKAGNVVEPSAQAGNGKYVPPALRKLMAMNTDEKKKEHVARLKRTLKGLLNRLAESNMAGIANQMEGMYQKYSHNDMNDCLSQLYMESIVAPTLTPERLVQEHALLIAVLSANVGNQVGAHMLTEFVLELHDKMQEKSSSEEINRKEYDNMLNLVANLFNFKVVNAKIIYDILQKLADIFSEKEVELILLVLRTVGFSLRKEDPLALKTFIMQIQSQAASHQAKNSDNYSRICFMLEVIHSIKNNNPSKVPNYDPSHVEHLKKVMKGLIHKGNNLSPLHVTLDDILNSQSQGRWWIVGSAWSGGLKENKLPSATTLVERNKVTCMEEEFSDHFKKRAAKLQLTRPPRINIMYIITDGSEDYLDAFDKLLQLKLPANQEQEIFNVMLLCCQKSKVNNEFFSHLAIRICKFDKKYKRLLQFAVWDKFKELESCKERELENIAKFVVHLVCEDALNITILKTLSFIDADEQLIGFVKVILKDILLHPSGSDRVLQVFNKISARPELQVFSQSLRIFISKFIISKKKKEKPKYQLLYARSQEVLELLSMRGGVAL